MEKKSSLEKIKQTEWEYVYIPKALNEAEKEMRNKRKEDAERGHFMYENDQRHSKHYFNVPEFETEVKQSIKKKLKKNLEDIEDEIQGLKEGKAEIESIMTDLD